MLCQFFRRRKKVNVNSTFTRAHGEMTNHRSEDSSKCFSHNLNLMPKDFNYVFSLIEKSLKFSVSPEIKLKTNPPYLPIILRNFNVKLVSIIKYYERNLSELSDNYYFRVLIGTLIKLCKDIIGIFRKAVKSTFDEFSLSRQKIIHNSFLLSHLFHSLVALFPNDFYSPESFRITKADAADWWHSHFGVSTTVVKWKDFFHVFSKINDLSELSDVVALKKTINVTGSGFVSIFDFDVFVRLFQPWCNIMETWKIIVLEHPGCMPLLTYEQVVQILKTFKYCPGAGSYIFRFSCTKPGQWAIGYIDISGKIFQTIVHNKSLAVALCEGEQSGIYKFPNGTMFDSSKLQSLRTLPPQSIIVSQEEHEAYCRIDSSFEVCKICELNHKNVRLEPCGHLLCDFCLAKWQKSFRYQGCPFCRFQIKGIEPVSLVPYRNNSSFIDPQRHEAPKVPPRLSSILSSSLNLNYAKLDWLSLNDSGYCMYFNYEDDVDGDGEDGEGRSEQTKVKESLPTPVSTSIHYQNTFTKPYLNDPGCSTSRYDADEPRNQMHITDSDVAMRQLLKITNNDVPMSQEILRYFELRSVAVGT